MTCRTYNDKHSNDQIARHTFDHLVDGLMGVGRKVKHGPIFVKVMK